MENLKNKVINSYKTEIENLKKEILILQENKSEFENMHKKEIQIITNKINSDNIDTIKNLKIKHSKELEERNIRYRPIV